MTDNEKDTAQDSSGPADKPTTDEAAKTGDPVKRWTWIILAISLALLVWYLRADRVTPYTSQARVHALVIPIAPEVSGTVTNVFVTNNQVVEKGQKLFQIDIERYQFAVQAAEAALDQARQAQGAAQASVDSARASLQSAQANEERARQDALRMRNIREQDPGAISERRIESSEASLVSAQSGVLSRKAALDAAIQQLGKPGDENASIQQAKASLDSARLNLERATVVAPEAGVVTGVQLDTGNFAGAGAPQLTFISRMNVWIQADYKENNLGNLSPGDSVDIVFDVLPGEIISGTVREIGFGVSVNSPPLGSLPTISNDNNWLRSAQRYPVLIDFDLPISSEDGRLLKVGSQASVAVYTGTHPLFNLLARFQMRLVAWFSYAY